MKSLRILTLAGIIFAAYSVHAEAPAPSFDGMSIRVGANFGLCGLLTIKPIPKSQLDPSIPVNSQYKRIYLRAIRYNDAGNEKETTGVAELPIQGKQFSYGWAGLGDAHYKIYVFTKDENLEEIPLDASKYVTIKADHNGACVGDRDSYWEPLKMR